MIYCHHKPLETDYIIMINGIIIYIFVLINENIEQDLIKGLVGHEHFFRGKNCYAFLFYVTYVSKAPSWSLKLGS